MGRSGPVNGSREERGYGPAHRRLRKQWAPKVERGEVFCCRCGGLIYPDTPWDLDHDETVPDRKTYRGVAHRSCNRRAAAIKTNQQRSATSGQFRPKRADWW